MTSTLLYILVYLTIVTSIKSCRYGASENIMGILIDIYSIPIMSACKYANKEDIIYTPTRSVDNL